MVWQQGNKMSSQTSNSQDNVDTAGWINFPQKRSISTERKYSQELHAEGGPGN